MANILLVDDEKVARALYSDFLVGAGHQVESVGTSGEAKASLAASRFDLVVTDLILPQSDGMELLQHVKLRYPGIEVIVITALDKVDPAVRAIKSGASDYLVKPIHHDVLHHAVRRALTTRSVLRENEDLRRHVALLEAGQRLATTLDRETLHATACAAFLQRCGADAVMLALRSAEDRFPFEAHQGLSDEEHVALDALLSKGIDAALAAPAAQGQELAVDGLPEPYETGFLVPLLDGERVLGAVALLFKGDIPSAVASAPFLAGHLALGLRNLGRFAEVEDLVYLDDLTHLFNSRYLELVLDKELKNATEKTKPFSLLFTDLDYFKSINDTHGHIIGSKLLVEVARILKGCVRDNDVVCRWGGDEFVLLLRGTDSGGALKVGERIRRSVESHRFLAREGFSLSVTMCLGVASYPEHANEKDSLLDFADRAMYRGKKGTRNIIYLAAKGLEAKPASRQNPSTPPDAAAAELAVSSAKPGPEPKGS